MFDPYLDWFKIPAGKRPPNYYELLDLAREEADDPVAVQNAAERRADQLMRHTTGPHSEDCLRVAGEVDAALKNGVGFSATMLLKDTSHRTVFPVWQPGAGFGMKELEGAADVLMLPDPATFRALPWAPHSGWMLCDIYFADGRPMPLSRLLYANRRCSRPRFVVCI